MEVFKNSVLPKRCDNNVGGDDDSVDVIINLENMINVGFYCYINEKWYFHSDTFVSPYIEKEGSEDKLKDFHWCYVPEEIANIET